MHKATNYCTKWLDSYLLYANTWGNKIQLTWLFQHKFLHQAMNQVWYKWKPNPARLSFPIFFLLIPAKGNKFFRKNKFFFSIKTWRVELIIVGTCMSYNIYVNRKDIWGSVACLEDRFVKESLEQFQGICHPMAHYIQVFVSVYMQWIHECVCVH